jgi:hypothetical protein
MVEPKHSTQKAWLLALGCLLALVAAVYFWLHPPLPSYLKVPPGSQVRVSRRFFTIVGPDIYCRIHSPLDAWQTARYMRQSSGFPEQRLAADRLRQPVGKQMEGWGSQSAGSFISLNYAPDEMRSGRGEVHSLMRVWPEPQGSMIEFYLETKM